MRKGPCPKCGSSEVVKNVRVMDRGEKDLDAGNLHVAVYGNPQAWMFKEQATSELFACVCAECGYTELYASDPRSLAQAAAAAKARRR